MPSVVWKMLLSPSKRFCQSTERKGSDMHRALRYRRRGFVLLGCSRNKCRVAARVPAATDLAYLKLLRRPADKFCAGIYFVVVVVGRRESCGYSTGVVLFTDKKREREEKNLYLYAA